MKRRAFGHDYHDPGTYMLTLAIEGRRPLFGSLQGGEHPAVTLTPFGERVRDVELRKIHRFYPMVFVWAYVIMPDHIHLIVRVAEPLPPGKHLGHVVRGFKGGCTRAWYEMHSNPGVEAPCTIAPTPTSTPLQQSGTGQSGSMGGEHSGAAHSGGHSGGMGGEQSGAGHSGGHSGGKGGEHSGATVPGVSTPARPLPVKLPPVFEPGYNDGILMHAGQLEAWRQYLKDNPRRLAIKRANPDLFKVWHGVKIGDWQCQMIGNVFMLNHPDIMAVIVHRADSDAAHAHNFNKWMACGERGGILVSAAIAKREKEVMREAMNRGYKIILLRENGFHEYYKPGGKSFDLCARGLMLQVCPWQYHTESHKISRNQCLELNSLALTISHGR